MRGIFGLIVGIGLVAFAAGFLEIDSEAPLFLRIILALFGLILIWASLYHSRLRLKRWAVYNGGREKHGFACLLRQTGEDNLVAEVTFKSANDEWLITLDSSSMKATLATIGDQVQAIAWLGKDGLIYGLDLNGQRTLPLSPGQPITREMREKMDRQSQRRELRAQRLSS
ncbi:hypothetical protein QWY75_09225 [Pontixanthobacter aestiaquae]|uniref:Uncharacterized protein n=1 Tax=Pontixanthobacter aestiaquae TaxID=1509367 RepID=A0A844Z5M5_9SPHN|nr:hypothetical protein [Pontixanthobacter aestiaquae]MDN3646379.1 hypothetical protein [Pontixanthobacter aestiaquae]MXO82632.1 hypothetical protein [Pontixanthobacter aestiaquae]